MAIWSDWRTDKEVWPHMRQNPYVNWWQDVDADRFDPADDPGTAIDLRFFLDALIDRSDSPDDTPTDDTVHRGMPPGYDTEIFPVPRPILNPDFKPSDPKEWIPDAKTLRTDPPPQGTVIVGIIDEGISPSHRSFLDEADNSRILAAWQQNAVWSGPKQDFDAVGDTSSQAYLPFGRELYQKDIDRLIHQTTRGGLVDQAQFNRLAGLSDFSSIDGHRALEHRVSHGTHVAALVAADTPHKMMVVNLPNRNLVGLSGSFLEFFFMMGVLRIIGLADALFDKLPKSEIKDKIKGYPIVINLSFSKQAGPRDAVLSIWNELIEINATRQKQGKSKVHFIFPAGNDNLLEGVGKIELPAKADGAATEPHVDSPIHEVEFEILVPVEDQSSSFIEIWTAERDNNVAARPPLWISISGPGELHSSGPLSAGEDGQFRDMIGNTHSPLARLYSTVFDGNDPVRLLNDGIRRQRFVLALRPTLIQVPHQEAFPPGVWKIRLSNQGALCLDVSVNVQSDQSALPGLATGLRPRLLDRSYQRYEVPSGRSKDSYPYSYPYCKGNLNSMDGADFIQRHGTINAVAAAITYANSVRRKTHPHLTRAVVTIAGYRLSDGRPAEYSSTGLVGLVSPDVSFPTEFNAVASGTLSSGARDGSSVALSGTSFASAQATCVAANILADSRKPTSHRIDLVTELQKIATRINQPDHYCPIAEVKSGRERLPPFKATSVDR